MSSKKRLLLNIAFGFSSRKVRVGQGKNEGNLVTHSLSAKEHVTCVMRMQKIFRNIFPSIRKPQTIEIGIISSQTGSLRRGGGGGARSIGGAWG